MKEIVLNLFLLTYLSLSDMSQNPFILIDIVSIHLGV